MTGRAPTEEASTARATRTVERALALLSAVTDGEQGGTLSELARATDLSVSTAGRLLATLARHEFLRRDGDARYRPGPRLKQIAAATLRQEPLYELSGPYLMTLAQETEETASLGVLIAEDRVLYLRQVPGTRLVQIAGWTGRTIPAQTTALGKALRGELEPQGYVSSHWDESDVTAVAAPIRDHHGEAVGALSITAPAYRTSAKDIHVFGDALTRAAYAMSLALGAPNRP